MDIIRTVYYVYGASKVIKLIFDVLDVPFNSGHYTVIVKRQFLYINIYSFSTIFT